jgi:hypothetical protein
MSTEAASLFSSKFLRTLKDLIALHHSIYPRIPPQGVFFESLVEQAFIRIGWPKKQVVLTTPNSPQHDLRVGQTRISIKSETGTGTNAGLITITKLCTTETGNWDSSSLIRHALSHLSRHDLMLMLRATWGENTIHYQLVDIPLSVLRLLKAVTVLPVGRRTGRQSLAVDILQEGKCLFRVHFDGADGKCQVRKLDIGLCRILMEWDQPVTV